MAEMKLWRQVTDSTDNDLTILNPDRALTDAQRRTQMCRKFGRFFDTTLAQMMGGPGAQPWTYVQIISQLKKLENVEKMKMTPETRRGVENVPSETVATPSLINNSEVALDPSGKPRKCKNCQGNHYLRECEKMCKLCSRSQRNHHPLDCSEFKKKQQQRKAKQKKRQRDGSNNGNGNNMYDSVENKKTKPESVQSHDVQYARAPSWFSDTNSFDPEHHLVDDDDDDWNGGYKVNHTVQTVASEMMDNHLINQSQGRPPSRFALALGMLDTAHD